MRAKGDCQAITRGFRGARGRGKEKRATRTIARGARERKKMRKGMGKNIFLRAGRKNQSRRGAPHRSKECDPFPGGGVYLSLGNKNKPYIKPRLGRSPKRW